MMLQRRRRRRRRGKGFQAGGPAPVSSGFRVLFLFGIWIKASCLWRCFIICWWIFGRTTTSLEGKMGKMKNVTEGSRRKRRQRERRSEFVGSVVYGGGGSVSA